MPAGVAARPRDARGYPVLAISPWRDAAPVFAVTSPDRILVCAVERRCSICGLGLGKGPVWRVVGADEAAAIAVDPTGFVNAARTVEPPGHEGCMLYAAVVCPWLARPNARRRLDAQVVGLDVTRGDSRGTVGEVGGAVVSFRTYEFTVGERVEFGYRDVVDFRPHLLGEEHLVALREAIAGEEVPAETCPPWLLDDETAAKQRAQRYL
jgi:hypothetical protein